MDNARKQEMNGTPFEVDLQTPVDAVRIIDACFESVRTGKPVDIELD